MDGKALAERIRGEIAEEVRELGEIGLATVLVGDDPASDIYIRLKHKAAAEVGINARDIRLASQTTEEELLEQIDQLNADDAIDGLLVQLPLPDHIDEARVIRALDPVKDVDGLHPLNFGQLALGRPTHVGATPVGVMALLEELCNRLATDDGIHHGAGMAYERVLLEGAGKKMNQRLVDAANRLLPIFIKHALWRPKARAVIGRLMYERDLQRLEEDLQEGVKLAESLGLDVSGVELPRP